jgi:hypothetical protein
LLTLLAMNARKTLFDPSARQSLLARLRALDGAVIVDAHRDVEITDLFALRVAHRLGQPAVVASLKRYQYARPGARAPTSTRQVQSASAAALAAALATTRVKASSSATSPVSSTALPVPPE